MFLDRGVHLKPCLQRCGGRWIRWIFYDEVRHFEIRFDAGIAVSSVLGIRLPFSDTETSCFPDSIGSRNGRRPSWLKSVNFAVIWPLVVPIVPEFVTSARFSSF